MPSDPTENEAATGTLLTLPPGSSPGNRTVEAGLDALDSAPDLPGRAGVGRVFLRSVLPPIVFLAALVAIWQLAYTAGVKPPYALPSPADVAATFWQTVQDGSALGRGVDQPLAGPLSDSRCRW